LRLSEINTSVIGLLRVLLAASLAVPAILFLVISWLNYNTAISDAERDLERISEVARENADKVFDSQNQLIDQVNDLVSGLSEDNIRANESTLHDALGRMVARLPHVATALVASSSGMPLVSAAVYPVPRDVDLQGRDYFQAVIGRHRGPFVSSLQVGDVYRQPFFGLGRPWTGPDGQLRGVIDVAVSPNFFAEFYQVLLGEGAGDTKGKVIVLIRDDGQMLVRYPRLSGPPPMVTAPNLFLDAVKAAPDGGTYTNHSIVDAGNPSRLFSYRKVHGYPLYVVAGRSWQAILADWRWTMAGHLLFGIPATAVLFLVTWTALVRAKREQLALQVANQEIRRREIAEDALLRSQRLEAVGQMTGGVAHDFNNLLTVILGNAVMIGRRADDAVTTRRLAANIQLASKRGAEITHQLLAFAGRQMVRPETINLNSRLREFRPLLERAASEATQLELDLEEELDPVDVDPGQFESAVLNLVGNARDAMPNGGRIVVTTRSVTLALGGAELPAGPCVRVAVSDCGVGMDRETVAKAFEPFFTTKGVGKGTGLGLSQVYGFARQAGGNVRIVSSVGAGTCVEITLPAARDKTSAALAEPATVASRAVSHLGKVILIVEDEPNVREMAVETLTDLGYATVAAADAATALRRLRQADRVDVLFSDIVMPGGMNGVQLSTEARRLQPGIRIVLTSGHTATKGEDLPADVALLRKPYNPEQLSKQLEACLQA